jgi:hypothetical protein
MCLTLPLLRSLHGPDAERRSAQLRLAQETATSVPGQGLSRGGRGRRRCRGPGSRARVHKLLTRLGLPWATCAPGNSADGGSWSPAAPPRHPRAAGFEPTLSSCRTTVRAPARTSRVEREAPVARPLRDRAVPPWPLAAEVRIEPRRRPRIAASDSTSTQRRPSSPRTAPGPQRVASEAILANRRDGWRHDGPGEAGLEGARVPSTNASRRPEASAQRARPSEGIAGTSRPEGSRSRLVSQL